MKHAIKKSKSSKAPDMLTFKPAQKLSAIFSSLIARSSFGIDSILRIPLAVFFGILAYRVSRGVVMFVLEWSTLEIPYKPLRFAALVSNFVFLFTLLSLTVLRSKPIRSFPTWTALLAAILGTCLPLSLVMLPVPELPPFVTVISIVAVGTGCGLSIWTARWLGRSFSIAPQARQLVTGGAYSIVRHPLYLCEEIAVLGAVLAYLSPLSVAIAAIHWVIQLQRMKNEELILRETFPEYAEYAATVPRLIPGW